MPHLALARVGAARRSDYHHIIERLNHIFRLGFGSAAIDAEICLRPVQCRVTFNRTVPPNVFYVAGWGVTISQFVASYALKLPTNRN